MKNPIQSFKDLIVWQRSISLVTEAYVVAQKLPEVERFGLASQIRRAAVSIPSNIAEGTKRKTRKDYVYFLRTANGSAAELETLFIIVTSMYRSIDCQKALGFLLEVQKMLGTMIKGLEV